MKSTFNLLYSIALIVNLGQAYARDVILINAKSDSPSEQLVIKVLTQKFNIPRQFIQTRPRTKDCLKLTTDNESLVHLCIDDHEELVILKISKYGVENTLNEFINLKNEALNEK